MVGLTDPDYLPPSSKCHGCATTGRGRRSQFQMMEGFGLIWMVRCGGGGGGGAYGFVCMAIWPTPHDDDAPSWALLLQKQIVPGVDM